MKLVNVFVIIGRGTGANMEKRPNDWGCESCGNTNFSFRQECNRCHTPRGGGVSFGPMPRGAMGGGRGGGGGPPPY